VSEQPLDALDLLLRPMAFFVAYPAAAALIGVLFLVLAHRAPKRTGRAMGVAWLLYAAYETGMHQRWLCSGECNIRVDLLLIAPLLLLGALATSVRIWAARNQT